MTRINLSHLTLSDQLEYLYTDGVYLSKRKIGDRIVLLYHLSNTYVEIYYKEYRKEAEHIVYSNDAAILDPYLSEIKLDFFR